MSDLLHRVEDDLRYVGKEIEEGATYVGDELRELGQDVLRGAGRVESRAEGVVSRVLNWGPWEMILHVSAAALLVYLLYLMVMQPSLRKPKNLLLLLISLCLLVQVHQNINVRKNLNA